MQRFIFSGSPSSSTIIDAMSWNLKPSFLHCQSHMNRGSYHQAESLTALGTKRNSSLSSSLSTSMSFCWHDSHSCVCQPTLSAPQPSSFSASSQHRSLNLGPHAKPHDRHQPRAHLSTFVLHFPQVQLHLQSFRLGIPPLCLHRHQQYPKPLALTLPPFFFRPLFPSFLRLPRSAHSPHLLRSKTITSWRISGAPVLNFCFRSICANSLLWFAFRNSTVFCNSLCLMRLFRASSPKRAASATPMPRLVSTCCAPLRSACSLQTTCCWSFLLQGKQDHGQRQRFIASSGRGVSPQEAHANRAGYLVVHQGLHSPEHHQSQPSQGIVVHRHRPG